MHDDEIVSMVLSVPTLWRALCLSHPFNLKEMVLGTTAELLACKAESRHASEEARFCCWFPHSHSFCHCPQFVDTGEGQKVDRPVNGQLPFHTQPSLRHRINTESAALPLLHQSICQSPFPPCPHNLGVIILENMTVFEQLRKV